MIEAPNSWYYPGPLTKGGAKVDFAIIVPTVERLAAFALGFCPVYLICYVASFVR